VRELAKRMRIQSVAFALMLGASGAASAAPFPTRDQNPLLSGFGLPTPLPASITDGWSVGMNLNWGSTALIQAHEDEALIVDAETREARLTIQRALTERIAVRLQVPYRYTGAGSLDGFIDDWHDAFSLPEGARPILPEDQMRMAYTHNGPVLLDMDSSYSGFADASLDFGYALRMTPSSSLAAWLSLEAPTGDAASLTSNEAFDASFALAGEHRFGDRWSIFAQAGVSWLGEGELLPEYQRDVVWSGLAGLSWRAFEPLELKVQMDAHTAVFDGSQLDFLNESIALTVGGVLHFRSGWRLELGVTEDLAVETTPDVVFVLGIRRER
jgi:Protein of unknown function (DUF3187)